MHVRRRVSRDLLADDRVVEREQARRLRRELERDPAGNVVKQVPNEVSRAAEHGLGAVAAMRRVDPSVVEDADVVDAAVRLDEIVPRHVDVVVVDVDRGSPPVRVGLRRAVGRDADAVMEVRDGVVSDDVSGAVDLDGVVAADFVGAVGSGATPQRTGPADQQIALLESAEEDIVRDVEVARSGVLGPHAEPDVFETTVLDGESHCSGNALEPREDGDVGVPEGDPVEDVMGRGTDIEQAVVARAIEDHLPVASGPDRDRLFRSGLDR